MQSLLEKNVRLYKELIDRANVLICAFDAEGVLLIWNKVAEEMTGYVKKQVLGSKKILSLLYPDPEYRREVSKSIGAAFKNDYKNVEFVLTTKYREKKCISWSTVQIKDKKGVVVGSFSIGIDVTIKNLVKQRERKSFRALLKSVRYHEDTKQQYEESIRRLQGEVNVLCRELKRPARY